MSVETNPQPAALPEPYQPTAIVRQPSKYASYTAEEAQAAADAVAAEAAEAERWLAERAAREAEEKAAQERAAEQAVSEPAPVDAEQPAVTPAQPVDDAPVEEPPADHVPADAASSDEAPADAASSDEVPTDAASVDELPTDEALPADEATADELPADELPATDAADATVPAEPAEAEPTAQAEAAEAEPTAQAEPAQAEPAQAEVPDAEQAQLPTPTPPAEVEDEEPPLSVLPFLRALSELSGSDLHCKVGAAPRIRIDGRLRRLKSRDLRPSDTEFMLSEVIRADVVQEFAETNEGDFAFSLAGVGRFRVNAYRARGSVGLVFRRVSVGAVALSELGVPDVIASLALEPRGLVLVTGPTGSGKTTTLAGMVDHINTTKEVHIVTIEDPIEVMHVDKNSIINQREVGLDTRNFAVALRAAMRQDPDVVLVGEMRDAETVGASLSASETGHFVMSTLHTTDAAETITRVIDFFPPHEQKQVRLSLSAALKGIVCQRLVPRADGQGRVVVMEICVNNGRIADAIADPEKTHMITDLIREGTFYGMQTFDQHLVSLYRDHVVTLEDAMHASSNPHDLQVELRSHGLL